MIKNEPLKLKEAVGVVFNIRKCVCKIHALVLHTTVQITIVRHVLSNCILFYNVHHNPQNHEKSLKAK